MLCFGMIGWLACSLALVRVDAYCVAHFFTFHTFSARATIFRTLQSCKFHLHRRFTQGIFLKPGIFPILSELIKKFVRLLRKLENTQLCWSLCSMSGTNASQPSSSIYDYRSYVCHQHITPLFHCRTRDPRDDGSERMQPLWQSPHPWNSFHCRRRSLTASIFYIGK